MNARCPRRDYRGSTCRLPFYASRHIGKSRFAQTMCKSDPAYIKVATEILALQYENPLPTGAIRVEVLGQAG